MRRFFLSLLAGVMALVLLAGCSEDPSSPSGGTTAPHNDPPGGVTAPTTPTAPQDDREATENVAEGALTEAQASAFNAQAAHSYVQYTTAKDPTVTANASYYNADGSFFDDFAGGINTSIWSLVQQRWGSGNNGVKRDHVYYTEDGVLVLQGNGDYYDKKTLRRAGACLETYEPLGPGDFEVRMKVHPQLGSCTAMWTYFNDGRNHEIDIELPGNKRTFKYSLFTNWITESRKTSRNTIPDFFHNDGEWHTYRFDWHTDPAYIDYYVDGEFQVKITTNIPTVAGNFWLGVWFPKDWCGAPNFETNYMLVDWVKYTPNHEPFEDNTRRAGDTKASQYPKEATPLPVNNYVADGGFEKGSVSWSTLGEALRVDNPHRPGNLMLQVGKDSSVSQVLYSINEESEYQITAAAAGIGAKAKLRVECLSATSAKALENGTFELSFDGSTMTPQTLKFKTAKGTFRLRITMCSEGEGDVYFDDVYVTQPSRGDFIVA